MMSAPIEPLLSRIPRHPHTENTYPPRKAPTGFRTGSGVATTGATTSASCLAELWKLRAVRKAVVGVKRQRVADERNRLAILLFV